jgi:hypothetical protein
MTGAPADLPDPSGPPADQGEDRSVLVVRAQLFVSSQAPLFAILAIRFHPVTLRVVRRTHRRTHAPDQRPAFSGIVPEKAGPS